VGASLSCGHLTKPIFFNSNHTHLLLKQSSVSNEKGKKLWGWEKSLRLLGLKIVVKNIIFLHGYVLREKC
jgi:hypothetical protein